ncbi:MAG: hypothetical protein K6G42_04690 [Lachnospiraceae bacterium]|nr:hypothetical protein [Lachnospiraceae bacterium]
MDNNDIELFSTTDLRAKDKVVSTLVKHRVSYLERWEKVPLLRRREYGGAKELCVIYVNGNQYGKAKKILDEFNASYAEAKGAKKKKKRSRRGDADGFGSGAAEEMPLDEEGEENTGHAGGDDIDDGIDDL